MLGERRYNRNGEKDLKECGRSILFSSGILGISKC
jgi:hypothetical protein